MIRADKVGRVLNCSMCLKDYYDHRYSEQLCLRCFKDLINFKDLEDNFVQPLEDIPEDCNRELVSL